MDSAPDSGTSDTDALARRAGELCDQAYRALGSDLSEARRLAVEAWRLAARSGHDETIARTYLVLGYHQMKSGNPQRALRYYRKAISVVGTRTEARLMRVNALVHQAIASVHLLHADFEKAIEECDESLRLAQSLDEPGFVANALGTIATAYFRRSEYDKAIALAIEARRIFELTGDMQGLATTLANLGGTYIQLRMFDLALECFEKAIEIARTCGNLHLLGKVLGSIGEVYGGMGDFERALDHYRRSLEVIVPLGLKKEQAYMLTNIGEVHLQRGHHEAALEFEERALAIFGEMEDHINVGDVLRRQGTIHMLTGGHETARALMERALNLGEQTGSRALIMNCHESLAELYETIGDTSHALDHYKRFRELKEELDGGKLLRKVTELRMQDEVDRADRMRERYRNKAAELESDLESREREMTAFALRLGRVTSFVENLQSQLAPIAKAADSASAELARSILRQIDRNEWEEQEWGAFEEQFRHIHPKFLQMLAERFPVLTGSELKVCSLLKINMANKEIAKLLSVSLRTVEKHRQHIRSKIGLPADASLGAYLASL